MQILKTILLWCARAVLIGGAFLVFFRWAPWLACKPLSNLATEDIPVDRVPPDAGCYTVEHGKISFANHGTIADDPYRFIATTAMLVRLWGLFYWSFRWEGSNRQTGFLRPVRVTPAGQRRWAISCATFSLSCSTWSG